MSLLTHNSRRGFLKETALAAVGGLLAPQLQFSGAVAAADESPWQIGCFTRPWDKHDYKVALDAIAEAGYKYVGLMTTATGNHLVISIETSQEQALKIGEECAQRGLKIVSVYGGDIPVNESLAKGIEGLKKLIDACTAAKAANLMMGGVGDPALYDPYFKAIAECCDYAAAKNIGISMKPHGGLNSTGPECRKSVEKVGHDNFRIWYDPGNIFYYSDAKLDPIVDAPSVNGLVVGMSIKDYRHPKEVLLTPGTGQVNFPRVMELLKAGGFTSGALVVETLTQGELPQLLAEAKKARAFVMGLVS